MDSITSLPGVRETTAIGSLWGSNRQVPRQPITQSSTTPAYMSGG